jgi:hypothetical protein
MVRRGYILNELAEVADSKRAARELSGRAAAAAEEVLAAVDPGESPLAERIHYCAVHNLANALRRLRVADTWKALGYIREARKLLKGQRSRMARARLDWVEAIVWDRLGMHARASSFPSTAPPPLECRFSLDLPLDSWSFDYRRRRLRHAAEPSNLRRSTRCTILQPSESPCCRSFTLTASLAADGPDRAPRWRSRKAGSVGRGSRGWRSASCTSYMKGPSATVS